MLVIHDTLTGDKRPFQPLKPGKVGLYLCGVTVYDLPHVGHARAAIAFDVVVRWLRHLGYEVTFVRNYTDVDDKIINRARERGVEPGDIAREYVEAYQRDLASVGLEPPSVEPKATEHIPEMIEVIRQLVAGGFAYQAGGDVYFAVKQFPRYGRLSGRTVEEMRKGEDVEGAERKRDPADFALWKGAKEGEPFWDSPWGKGRPGWHIECSAMARRYLGQPFDIHGGGDDLIFPHHENEIAQSECSGGSELARYWMHNAMVRMGGKAGVEKMSKSLGNVRTVREVVKRWDGETLRLFAIRGHYRSPLDFSEAAMEEAAGELEYLYRALDEAAKKLQPHGERTVRIAPAKGPEADEARRLLAEMEARFAAAMDDDFNTSVALSVLHEAARVLNRLTERPHLTTGGANGDGEWELAMDLRQKLSELAAHLGLLQQDPVRWLETRRSSGLERIGMTAREVEEAIAERQAARMRREFKKADEIRERLEKRGVLLEDSPGGTTWKIKSKR